MDLRIFRRTIETSLPISGYYKYKDVFQILPSKIKNDTFEKTWMDIEYNEKYHSVVFDTIHNHRDHGNEYFDTKRRLEHLNFLKELISLLTIVCNIRFHYEEKDYNINENEPYNSFSKIDGLYPIRRDQNRIYQNMNFGDDFLSIQDNADTYFDKYFQMNLEERKRYRMSTFLYYNAFKVWFDAPSLAIIGYISAIENLIDFESKLKNSQVEKCDKCGQLRYQISKKFRDFMSRYSGIKLTPAFKKTINEYYSRRSKISHAGALLYLDYINNEFSNNEYNYIVELQKNIRVVLYNYILNK